MKVYEAEKVISLWKKYHHYIAVKAEHFDYELKRMPTVEAEPVRHGKWLYIRTDDDGNGLYECSVCHAGEVHSTIVDVRYCWNCGARMDGTERKEE